MLEARFRQAITLKRILEPLKGVLQYADLEFSQIGLRLLTTDSKQAVYVDLLVRTGGFELYRCQETVSIGIHLDSMLKVLKCAHNSEVLTIKMEKAETSFTLVMGNETAKRTTEFQLRLLDLNMESLEIPDERRRFFKVTMPAVEFAGIVETLSLFSGTIKFGAGRGYVELKAGGDQGSGATKIRSRVAQDPRSNILVESHRYFSFPFASKYLQEIAKASSFAMEMSFEVCACKGETVLVVKFPVRITGANAGDSRLLLYLAPKIQDEEEKQE